MPQPHEDGPSYFPAVGTISLGSHTVVNYYRYRPVDEAEGKTDGADSGVETSRRGRAIDPVPILSVLLEPRSLVITTKELYTEFLHGIEERTQDKFCPHEGSSQLEAPDSEGMRIANYQMLRNNDIKKCIAEGGALERQTRISLTCRDYENVGRAGRALNTIMLPGGSR